MNPIDWLFGKKNDALYDAMHDKKTGLYNNNGFEMLYRDTDTKHSAVIIIELMDCQNMPYRMIEKDMRRMADEIRKSFRSVDDICRIRTDEIAIIMARMTHPSVRLLKRRWNICLKQLSRMQKADDAGTSFVLSAMYVAAGNFITAGQEDRIKEVLDMTALGRRYEQEKKQYADYRVAKVYVDLVDRKIQEKGLSEKEACTQVGITTETYEIARAVVDSSKEVEAV